MRAAVLAALLFLGPGAQPDCRPATVTGYVRTDPAMNATTADGTSILADEPIVAASYDVPMGSWVEVEGLGTFRVADRGGGLRPTHIDVAVWSRAEAFELTSRRTVCILPPEG